MRERKGHLDQYNMHMKKNEMILGILNVQMKVNGENNVLFILS